MGQEKGPLAHTEENIGVRIRVRDQVQHRIGSVSSEITTNPTASHITITITITTTTIHHESTQLPSHYMTTSGADTALTAQMGERAERRIREDAAAATEVAKS